MQAGGTLLGRDDGLEGLDRRPGHDRLGGIELLSQAVELVEEAQAQLRAATGCGRPGAGARDPGEELGLHDVGLKRDHLGQAGIPVGLDPLLGGGRDGDDPAVVGRGQAEDVAELPLGGDHVRGPGHQVEVELLELLLGLGDVGHGPLPTTSSACSRLTISRASSTAFSAAQSWTCCWARFQYCCSIDRTWAMTSALNRQTAGSALSRAITIGARLASRPRGGPAC